MKIRKEGFPFIVPAVILAFFVAVNHIFLGILFFAVAFVVINFFRDPERYAPQDAANCILSPADGRVVISRPAMQHEIDRFNLPEGSFKVAIFLNLFDVHVNRAPITGTITETDYEPGPKYPAFYEKSSELNEHMDLTISNPETTVVVRLIAGLVARRIVLWKNKGDSIEAGERIGMIKLGSRADIYFSANWATDVSVGDRVRAGESALARKI